MPRAWRSQSLPLMSPALVFPGPGPARVRPTQPPGNHAMHVPASLRHRHAALLAEGEHL